MVSTVRHGGGAIIFQGCMSASGVGNIVVINGIMDHLYYIQILKGNLGASAEKLGIEEDYQFYQDNDSNHSTHNTRLWLLYNCPKVIKTINQTPNFNPIEHLRSKLETKDKRVPFFLTKVKWRTLERNGRTLTNR
ncbi:transposable element Tc1 transposase [Trichonephila clavipes]|nr:transposable element Tc1 transposase [Trichonephila clavipes]